MHVILLLRQEITLVQKFLYHADESESNYSMVHNIPKIDVQNNFKR